MKTYPIIIDCDPGVDDIFAILVANSKPEIDIKAICSVSGNVGIDLTTHNARLIAGLLGLNCVVAKGASKPLIKDAFTAGMTHGSDGFGGCAGMFGDDRLSKLSDMGAVEVEKKILMESVEPVYIVATAPLTNIALLLSVYPEVKSKIAAISMMGGGINIGNITPFSEFNYFTDPEAAYIVMNSGVKLIMCGLNVTLQATLTDEELNEMRGLNNTISDVGVKILSTYIANDAAIHDPCAVLAVTDQDKFQYKDQFVQIDIRPGITQGMSYVDERQNTNQKSNCRVFYNIDKKFFRRSIVKSVDIDL